MSSMTKQTTECRFQRTEISGIGNVELYDRRQCSGYGGLDSLIQALFFFAADSASVDIRKT
jgi:hypothetical protein